MTVEMVPSASAQSAALAVKISSQPAHQGVCHGAQGVVFYFGAGGAQRFLGFLSLD